MNADLGGPVRPGVMNAIDSAHVPEDAAGIPSGLGIGSRVAGYLIEEQVGAGGMAVVFRALDEGLGRRVAVKVLAPGLAADAAFRRRFIRESRAAAAVDDPHIIPVHEAGESDGVLFIAMRYVPGPDVRTLLADQCTLPPLRVAAIISPVAAALDAAHAAGLVHRDVKPANMLLDVRPGRPDHVYLSDFGLAKAALASAALTASGQFLGTPSYIAPEQILGRPADGRTDQYALACAAFEMLTGHPPFERDQGMAVIWAHLHAEPPLLDAVRPGLSSAANSVLARALAKEPQERYLTCAGFAAALRAAFGLPAYHAAPDQDHPTPGHAPTQIAGPAADMDQFNPPAVATATTASQPAGEPSIAGGAQAGASRLPPPARAALAPGQATASPERLTAPADQTGQATSRAGLTGSAPVPPASSDPTVTAAAPANVIRRGTPIQVSGSRLAPPATRQQARSRPIAEAAHPKVAAAKRPVLRSAFLAGLTARNLREMLHLMLNGPAGIAGLGVIVLTLSLGGRTVVRAERFRVAALLHERTGVLPALPRTRGLPGRITRRLAGPVLWRTVAYLLLLVVIGIPGFITALLWAGGFMAVLQPLWRLLGTSASVVTVNGRPVHSVALDTITTLTGLLLFVLMPWAARGIAGFNRLLVRRLLAPGEPVLPNS
jgi:serine/threonine protein kinase